MADNLTTQSGTPATVPAASVIATDDVSSVHFQKVKLDVGGDGVSVPASGDATYGLDVDVTRVTGTVAVTGAFYPATQPVSIATMPSTPVTGTFWQATQPVSGTVVVKADTAANQSDSLKVDGSSVTHPISAVGLPLPTGAATSAKQPALGSAGTASTDVITVQGISGGTSLPVSISGSIGNTSFAASQATASSLNATAVIIPTTTGGLTIKRVLSLATSNAQNVKATVGQVYGWVITNTNASPRYVKLYNISGGGVPAPATDVPVMTLMVPGNSSGTGMVAAEFTMGIAFSNSIGLNIVTGVADNDTNTPSANEVIINLFYK